MPKTHLPACALKAVGGFLSVNKSPARSAKAAPFGTSGDDGGSNKPHIGTPEVASLKSEAGH